jgi:List-Bact-rpt repeat protein
VLASFVQRSSAREEELVTRPAAVALFSTLALLPATPLAAQPTSTPEAISVRRLSPTEEVGTIRGLPSHRARGPIYTQPPPPPPVDLAETEEKQPAVPLIADGIDIQPEQTVETGGNAILQPQVPGTFVLLRESALVAAGFNSIVNEPNVGSQGDGIFTSHNWYAEISTNNGGSFSYISPYSTFPASPAAFSRGFCCDQRVAQDSSRNLIFWYLQYIKNGSTSTSTNGVRLAVAHGQAGLAGNSWIYYDFTPALFGLPAGKWLDFPHLQASANYLYFTANVFNTVGDTFYGALVVRIPLSQLDSGSSITFDYFSVTGSYGAIMPVNGAATEGTRSGRTTMYFAAVYTSTSIKVLTWPESTSTLTVSAVAGLASTSFSTYACPGPGGLDPCTRASSRMQTGWITDAELGLMWTSAQSGASRPYPYTRVAILDPATLAVIAQPDIFNTTSAWLYPAISVNERGHLAGTVDNLGGNLYPTITAILRDDLSPDPSTSGWEVHTIAASNSGTPGLYGDYNGTMPHEKYPKTWLAVGHVQVGGSGSANSVTHNYWFGRERDTNPTFSVSRAGTGTGTVTSSPAGIDCGSTCSSSFTLGNTVTLTATPDAFSTFAGWSDACTGAGSCVVTMDAARSVTATFAFSGAPGLAYYTVAPCRVLDTRANPPALTSGVMRVLAVAGLCGIPVDAKAVAINLTAVTPSSGGHITVFPGNASLPATSSINFGAGAVRANNAVLALSSDGGGTLAAQAFLAGGGQVDLIVDVSGYLK